MNIDHVQYIFFFKDIFSLVDQSKKNNNPKLLIDILILLGTCHI